MSGCQRYFQLDDLIVSSAVLVPRYRLPSTRN